MFFIPRFRRLPPIQGETFAQRFARGVMLGCILAIAAWAFWTNVGHRLQGIKEDSVVRDEMHLVSDENRTQFIRLAAAFEENYGVGLSVKILRGDPAAVTLLPASSSKNITVSLYPNYGMALVELPPLVRTVVGESTRRQMEAFLIDSMQHDESLEGLVRTLRVIWDRMRGDPAAE